MSKITRHFVKRHNGAIVLYLRLFTNMGDKTHPFTISLCNIFIQKVRVETSHRNKSKLLVCAEKHKAREKDQFTKFLDLPRCASSMQNACAAPSSLKSRIPIFGVSRHFHTDFYHLTLLPHI